MHVGLTRPIFGAVPARLAFIRPIVLSSAARPPKGDDRLHEPKWDGFRFQVIKDGNDVRLYSKSGADYSNKLPSMRKAFAELPTNSSILDGEFVLIDPRGAAHFYRLMAQMRTTHPDESQLMFLAFDWLHQDGVDLRDLVVVAAEVHPSVAIPNRITAVIIATVAANEEDLATMNSVSHDMPVHDMPIRTAPVPGTRHCPEADGTGLSGVHAPDMAA